MCWLSVACSFFLITCACGCFFFFFSSRRRHTRYWRDWSSDVCSSDLCLRCRRGRRGRGARVGRARASPRRRSEERRVGKSVDLGGRRIIKKKKKKKKTKIKTQNKIHKNK